MYKNKWIAYLFITPMLLFLIVFLIYPFSVNIYNSFFKYKSVLDRNPAYVGVNNYVQLFTTRQFKIAIENTLLLTILVIVFQVGIALILALLVSEIKRLAGFFKTAYFIPIVISATALGLMFLMFFREKGGLFNQILANFNLEPIRWLNGMDSNVTLASMFLPTIWQYIGFYFVIFLTALNTISDETLEAAKIDGANDFTLTFKIKLPLIQNVTRVVLVLAITGTLKVFDLPYILNPIANPNGETFLLGTYMYHVSYFANKNLGLASAFAVILAILGVGFSGLVNVVFKQNKDI